MIANTRWIRAAFRSLADAVWLIFRLCARLFVRLIPPNRIQRAAIRTFRAEVESIPFPLETPEASQAQSLWTANRRRLREAALSRDPRAFLTWDVVTKTMFMPPYVAFVSTELAFLRNDDWNTWRFTLKEPHLGAPCPSFVYPFSSSNTIHHAYHLARFQVECDEHLSNFGEIFEFGGGYGSLCRIVHKLGFSGNYLIFDFPEQSALQRYYLSSAGIRNVSTISDFEALRDALRSTSGGRRLFIATWSLSESPYSLRKKIADEIKDFDAFLIAYQSEFGGIVNRRFFDEWQTWFPGVSWRTVEIDHFPPNTYLFGIAKRSVIRDLPIK